MTNQIIQIEKKVSEGFPLSKEEIIYLYDYPDLAILSSLANIVRERKNGKKVFYKCNFHIEPSNICRHRCEFCSYRRESEHQPGAWSMSIEQIRRYCREKYTKGMSEVHIVGSVHPERKFDYYDEIIRVVREELPEDVAIKAYSAVEIIDMCTDDGLVNVREIEEVLARLKRSGLTELPGGGAEILDDRIREKICPDKATSEQWIEVHRVAHKLGISSNATMLFGHIESREDRVNHIIKIRDLQAESGGFGAFIPLKYHSANNLVSEKYSISEVDTVEIMRTFAISRIALDNIPHIKAYWPMLGRENAQLALLFGADDIDGTINDSTKIYSLAGAEEQNPGMEESELISIVKSAGFEPCRV